MKQYRTIYRNPLSERAKKIIAEHVIMDRIKRNVELMKGKE